MEVTLRTRCGCERKVNLPLPLPREIVLPLTPKDLWFHMRMDNDDLDYSRPRLGVRVFERYDDHLFIETKERRPEPSRPKFPLQEPRVTRQPQEGIDLEYWMQRLEMALWRKIGNTWEERQMQRTEQVLRDIYAAGAASAIRQQEGEKPSGAHELTINNLLSIAADTQLHSLTAFDRRTIQTAANALEALAKRPAGQQEGEQDWQSVLMYGHSLPGGIGELIGRLSDELRSNTDAH